MKRYDLLTMLRPAQTQTTDSAAAAFALLPHIDCAPMVARVTPAQCGKHEYCFMARCPHIPAGARRVDYSWRGEGAVYE